MPESKSQKLLRSNRKAKGLCISCGSKIGKVQIQNGIVKCNSCRRVQRKYQAKRKIRLLELGICISCGKNKIHKTSHAHCIDCASVRKWQARQSKEKQLWTSAKARAKRKGLLFSIEVDDVVIPEICPLLEIPLNKHNERLCDSSPTIDRIDSSKGYIKGNVMVISFRANRIKSNAVLEEIEVLSQNLRKILMRD